MTVLLTDVTPFANKGLLEPLNEHMTAAGTDMEDFIDAALDITSVDGEAYGLPFRYDGSGIYYNVDILAQYGYDSFPTTWDEMLKLCDLIKADGKYGFAWPLGNQANAATRFVQQLYTYGGDVLNEDETECLLNSDAAVSALNAIASSVQNGQASPSSLEYDNTTMRDAFGSGELAFNFTGPFDAATLDADYPELNYATAVIPGIDGLIHISQIADHRVEKPGDELTEGQMVDAKIIAIDEENKKVSLSIRALLEGNDVEETEESEEA